MNNGMKDNNKMEKQQISNTIGSLVKTSRKSKGLSQYRLAKEAKITAVHVKGIEDGMLSPRVDTLNKICKALQMEIRLPIY